MKDCKPCQRHFNGTNCDIKKKVFQSKLFTAVSVGIITDDTCELMEEWFDEEYPTFNNWDFKEDYDLGIGPDWSEEKEKEVLAMIKKVMKVFCDNPYAYEDNVMWLERNLNINDTSNSSSDSNMEGEDSESSNPEGNYTGSVMLPESDLNDTSNSLSSSNMDSIGEEDSDSSNPECLYTGGLCTSKKRNISKYAPTAGKHAVGVT